MRKIVIIGGKLQGLEAVYLALKAGVETILIDKREATPASALCDRFICADVLEKAPELIAELKSADLVLPALENKKEIARDLGRAHGLIAYILAALVAGHAGAALKHHFVARDDILLRMAPRGCAAFLERLRGGA